MIEAIIVGFFLLGTVIGSFIDCAVGRLAKKEDIVFKRSYCPHCHHSLAWFELVPIFSFIVLKGRCRYCHQRIPWEHPVVELITGLLFVLIFLFGGPTIWTLFLILVAIPLEIVFLFDLKYSLIPSQLVYSILVFTLLFRLGSDVYQKQGSGFWSSDLFSSFLGMIFIGGFLGSLYLLTKGKGMGLGDVELGVLLGAILGWPQSLVGLFLSFLIGAILGLILIVLKKKNWKSEVPFGTFLILGTAIALIVGSQLIHWYLSLLYLG